MCRLEDYNPDLTTHKHFVEHMACKNQYPPPTLLKDLLREDSIRYKAQTPSPRVSGLRAVINAVKRIQLVKRSPTILPRNFSRRLLSRNSSTPAPKQDIYKTMSVKVTVTVKDIIRWKSFRDLQEQDHEAEDKSPAASPSRCEWSGSSSSPSSGSKGSSWCESDFSSEWWCQAEPEDSSHGSKNLSPSVGGRNFVEADGGQKDSCIDGVGQSKKAGNHQNNPSTTTLEVQPEQDEDEEEEQGEEADSSSNFDYTSADSETTDNETSSSSWRSEVEWEANDAVETNYEEGVHDKAWQLLDQVKNSSGKCWTLMKGEDEQLLLDFFTDELMMIVGRENSKWCNDINLNGDGGEENEMKMMIKKAEDWVSGGRRDQVWELVAGGNKDAYVKAMDEEGSWSKLGGEEVTMELGLAIEAEIFDQLIEDLLADVL